jgi:hypothetical protein
MKQLKISNHGTMRASIEMEDRSVDYDAIHRVKVSLVASFNRMPIFVFLSKPGYVHSTNRLKHI